MLESGRLSMAGVTTQNVEPLAAAIASVFLALVVGFITTLTMKLESDRNAQLAAERGDDLARTNEDLDRKREEAVANYELAEERRLFAERKTDEVLRLSALQHIETLLAEADQLWPVRSRDRGLYRKWIEDARALTAHLRSHIATRDALQERDTALSGEERWWLDQLNNLIAELEQLEEGHLSEKQTLPRSIARVSGGGWTMSFRLRHAELLARLHAEGGTCAKRWMECMEDLRAAYPGLELAVQEGLLPMGPDPDSGLWEFADIQSGYAELRDEEGFLRSSDRAAIVFVLLPGGTFRYGAQAQNKLGPNYDRFAQSFEGPPTEVEVEPFFLSKYELTQAQWKRFTGHNPSEYQPPSGLAPEPIHPVQKVSWNEAELQLARMGFVLPTEIQWEYAARAGTDTVWWTGNDPRRVLEAGAANIADMSVLRHGTSWPEARKMNWYEDGYVAHAPVGSFTPNAFGLHDTIGNVWEWCRNRFDDSTENRVMRGGSFRMEIQRARSAHRSHGAPEHVGSYLGLRPARKIESSNGR